MDKYGCWRKYKLRNDFYRYFNAIARRVGIKYSMKGQFNRSPISLAQTQELISDMILTGSPALVTRFGSNEANIIAQTIGVDLQAIKHYSKVDLTNINRDAGVFPYGHEMAYRFGRISIDAIQSIDLIGAWNSYMQDYLINEECPKAMAVTDLASLEPFFSDNPWTAALQGKKVLVIHPFKETIEKQYRNREKLFANPNILPEFELITMKAVQTIAHEMDSRFCDWEEALNYMYESAMKLDFDIALLGCGAYGMPLAAKLKESGKIAIHLGGALQLLFGIKGKRWDDMPQGKLYNEYWVRPLANERPREAQSVEGACYW